MAEALVSCLMVTANRCALARRAVECLARQSWKRVELVVVDDGDEDYGEMLAPYRARFPIRYERIPRDPSLRLGGLRNRSLALATGDVCAQWDDDEWYHPERLERQLAQLEASRADAVLLRQVLAHVDTPEYAEHAFRMDSGDGVPGSVLHRRSELRYANVARSEDLGFAAALARSGRVARLEDHAHLFLRCFHGTNTWAAQHFIGKLQRTPAYKWHWFRSAVLQGDPFRHPAFALNPLEAESIRDYRELSRGLGLAAGSERAGPPNTAVQRAVRSSTSAASKRSAS
jgi:glycosyltransferase involved in cell wall biosynthesis